MHSGARGSPQFLKKRSENAGGIQIFRVGSQQFQESLRELLRELWFSHCSSRETPLREWDFSFRELFSELRELLREYPGTLPELREWPFHSESVFPEIGVVPRLLMHCLRSRKEVARFAFCRCSLEELTQETFKRSRITSMIVDD